MDGKLSKENSHFSVDVFLEAGGKQGLHSGIFAHEKAAGTLLSPHPLHACTPVRMRGHAKSQHSARVKSLNSEAIGKILGANCTSHQSKGWKKVSGQYLHSSAAPAPALKGVEGLDKPYC